MTFAVFSIPIFHSHVLSMLSIPVVGGITGYVINWTGVWMLYQPLHFRGFRVPGLERFANRLPQKVRDVPGLRHGGIGWQGIIPSRASKLGSIAVDKQIGLIGTPADFYAQLDPEKIAEHLGTQFQEEVPELVDRVMTQEHPELWEDLPPQGKQAVYERVRERLPAIAHEVTDQLGKHIDEVLDIRQMVIRVTDAHPELVNGLFHAAGHKAFRFIIRFGFVFGFLCGLPCILIVDALSEWWVLPVTQAVIGYATNWLAIWLIYNPVEPRKLGPIEFQGQFLRRQHEASADYAEVVAGRLITLDNVADELLHGPRSDRTRKLIVDTMVPAVEDAAGVAGTLVRVATPERYEAILEGLAAEAPAQALHSLQDEELNRERNAAVRELFTERMREMSGPTFSGTLRAATDEDEWMLVAHGLLFGLIGGLLHYLVFGL